MIVLLDTQVWLWATSAPERLGLRARALLVDPTNVLLLSAASSWEIAIKFALGKIKLPEPPETFVPSRMARDGIQALPVEHVHALRVARLRDHHRDPFDRLLVAQALVEDIPLMTADPHLARYGLAVIPAMR
jgi:PIN domain nuclease of toxin-antitoxin system